MKLSDLLAGVQVLEVVPGADGRGDAHLPEIDVAEVRDDSRQVGRGDLFVAVPGQTVDGHRFLRDAAGRGMVAAVAERPLPAGELPGPQLRVASAAEALAVVAANRFGRPADGLLLIGITGTNGKTTTNFLVESVLQAAGYTTGLLGTVLYRYPGHELAAPFTTPTALELHHVLAGMRGAGVQAATLEVSSHALALCRLHGVRFRVAAFSNLTQDHLDFHGDMESYFQAKARLFREHLLPADEGGCGVVNIDSEAGARMAREVGRARLLTVSTQGDADVCVVRQEQGLRGTRATLRTPAGEVEIQSPLIGRFNLDNLALAAGIGAALGLPAGFIGQGLSAVSGVPGRLERVPGPPGAPAVFVDYAHSPDALERVLAALRPLPGTGGRLVVVFGCGGDRDRDKRPKMGQAAAQGADLVIVTSDNPRSEDPAAILDAIVAGVEAAKRGPNLAAAELAEAQRGYLVEGDRRAAILAAIRAARPADVVLIAGKGHEDYQITGATRAPFSDVREAQAALAERPREAEGAIELPLERVLQSTGGQLVRGGARRFSSVVIDGRAASAGSLFVAIRGANQDGHRFCGQAVAAGAAGVLVERGRGADLPGLREGTAVIEIDDTTVALGQIARAHRAAPEISRSLKLVAVTGSTGKTSTKDMIAAILAAHAGPGVIKTEGNLNNHWGVPLTLLRLYPGCRFAVVEMGMSARGEIAYLCSLADPDVGVITNVGPVHLESLGSLDNVARAKGELFSGMADGGAAVYPVGPRHALVQAEAVRAGVRSGRLHGLGVAPLRDALQDGPEVAVGVEVLGEGAEGTQLRFHLHGQAGDATAEPIEAHLPLLGAHQADNAGLAVAAALALDVPREAMAAGLAAVQPGKHRGQVLHLGGRTLIDDCYNASPPSVLAAIRALTALRRAQSPQGRALFVFGDMLELGQGSAALHEEVGRAAAEAGVALLVAVGEMAACAARAAAGEGVDTVLAATPQAAAEEIARRSRPGDWVLVKGSRGMKLEGTIDALGALLGQGH